MKQEADATLQLHTLLGIDTKLGVQGGHRDDFGETRAEALERLQPKYAAEEGLEFEDLTYTVIKKERVDGKWESTDLDLLQGLSGKANKGELTAIMGPSGAGKSTFLDALAGRIDERSLSGTVWLDGHPVTGSYIKQNSAYVMQQDILFPFLTVAETLTFSAEVRLPSTLSRLQKADRVHALIMQLGLENCAHTYIGDEKQRGISGGEKRRVSIGVDIIHSPSLLFLDEPTSGLDSTSALIVVEKLFDIASAGGTVLLTIHQPSYRIQMKFSNLIILARGKMVYQGEPDELAAYIEAIGGEVPKNENDIEYFMNIIKEFEDSDMGLDPLVQFQQDGNNTCPSSTATSNFSKIHINKEFSDEEGGFDHSLTSLRSPVTHELNLARNFYTRKPFVYFTPAHTPERTPIITPRITPRKTPLSSQSGFYDETSQIPWEAFEQAGRGKSPATSYSSIIVESAIYQTEEYATGWRYQNGWFREVMVLMWRSWKNVLRCKELFVSREMKAAFLSVLLATLLKDPKRDLDGIYKLIGYFVFLFTLVYFSCNDSLPAFIEERTIFIKETGSKVYRASSYSVASFLVYLPTNACIAITYVLIGWWALGLDGGPKGFLILFLILFASLVTANSFAMLVSAVVPNFITGFATVIALTALSFLTCGYFIKRSQIPVYWVWLHYMSFMKYSLEAALQNEFTRGKCFSRDPILPGPGPLVTISQLTPLPLPNSTQSSDCYMYGEGIIDAMEMNEFTIGWEITILLLWCSIYRVLFYIVLRFYSTRQRK